MYAYILPNGATIDSDDIVDAVLAEEEYPQMYLDTHTGKLIKIYSLEELGRWVQEPGHDEPRYFLIERFDDQDRNNVASDFIKIILDDMASDYVAGAKQALQKNGWRGFKKFLEVDTDGWIHGWSQFINDEAWEYMHAWLTENPHVPVKAVFEGCGNCTLCQLMRDGEDGNFAKLKHTFETENLMQNVEQQVQAFRKKQKSSKEKNISHTQTSIAKVDSGRVFVFKITLIDSSPRVWRRIAVPEEYTFFDLHCAIQIAMGWEDSHLHAFRIDTCSQTSAKRRGKDGAMITIEFPDPEADDFFSQTEKKDERKEHIADWFGLRIKQCVYDYDFGDSWEHTILLERIETRVRNQTYPYCITGKNACPPEDCGGVGGYRDLQEIVRTPAHPEHKNMLEWLEIENPSEFDPLEFDPAKITFDNPKKRLKEYEKGFEIEPI